MPHTDLSQPLCHQVLGRGCELTVVSAAHAQQCAVALSFAAGSHHEPPQYLGMAHFLEHLVFRGSQNYALDDGLMAFIQRNGGHVNAQTQAQQTVFHFQVQSPLFMQALERLVDMLVAPRLTAQMLRTEREVIHEEFALYCRAPQVLMDAAIAPCLVGKHPLQRFYAGHRQTLPVEDTGFAPALADFHQRAYLRSPLKIVLVLPSAWSSWQASVLATLQPLTHRVRDFSAPPVPDLRVPEHAALQLSMPVPDECLVVHIPINQAGQGLAELAQKTQHALALNMPQTFLAYAQQQGWCTDVSARASYTAQAQGVLTVQLTSLQTQHAQLFSALSQWLQQWRLKLGTEQQQAYEQQAQAHRWLLAEPLHKAQQVLAAGGLQHKGVSAECFAALDAVLAALDSGAVVQVHTGAADVDSVYDQGLPMRVQRLKCKTPMTAAEQMPQFMFPSDIANSQVSDDVHHSSATHAAAEQFSQYQPASIAQDLAVCYWGWTVPDPQTVAQRLPSRLADLSELLSYNAVQWHTECTADTVFMRLTGPAAYVPVALKQILNLLETPFVAAPVAPSAQFALRRLLQRVPQALSGALAVPEQETEIALATAPQSALWLGAAEYAVLLEARYLKRLQPLSHAADTSPTVTGWQQVHDNSTEDALLVVHIPLPAEDIQHKDQQRLLNRVFAQHLQTAVQRTLRDEQALCYAVFVLPYAEGEHEGLTCAVQSSKVSAAQLLSELRQCLAEFQARLPEHLQALQADIRVQTAQLQQHSLGMERSSAMLFRHWREQRLTSGVQAEVQAQEYVSAELIERYCQALQVHSRWLLLSNQSADASALG